MVFRTTFPPVVCLLWSPRRSLSLCFCLHVCSTFRSLSLTDVEDKCKEAAALKLPLLRLELNSEEARELFQVSTTSWVYLVCAPGGWRMLWDELGCLLLFQSSRLRLQLLEEQMKGSRVSVYRQVPAATPQT